MSESKWNVVGLFIVCLTIVAVVTSCSLSSVEINRISYAAKQTCFDSGGNWNIWVSTCEPPPTQEAETK